MKKIKQIDVREILKDCVADGKRTFSLPDPEPAFEVWFRERSGLKKKDKEVASKAWYAALKEWS